MKKVINTTQAPAPIGPYSQAVKTGNILFVSGQVALDPATGSMLNESLEQEIEAVLNNIAAVLKEAGMDFSNIVKTSIFLSDMNDFGVVNEHYSKRFSSDFPARETVEVSCLPKNARVEISVVASE